MTDDSSFDSPSARISSSSSRMLPVDSDNSFRILSSKSYAEREPGRGRESQNESLLHKSLYTTPGFVSGH